MATYYIDPTVAGTGTGTIGDPFKDWASVSWAAGNFYLQKAGTTYAGSITPGSSGTSGNPITIGRYGDGVNPIAYSAASYGVFLSAKQYIDIDGIDAVGCGSHGFYIRSNGSNVTTINIKNCVARLNVLNGFYIDGQVLTGSVGIVKFLRCESHANGQHGFDTLGIVQNVTWTKCKASGNGYTTAGHGFSLHPFISNNIVSGWTLSSGTVYTRTLSAGETVQKVINLTDGVTLAKNAGATTGITSGQWDQSGTTFYINLGANANTKTTAWKRAVHGPFYYYDCESWGNRTEPVAGEGHGFASDDMTDSATYWRCRAWSNAGAGFQCQYTNSIAFNACLAYSNALSNFRTTGYTDTLAYAGCTSADSVQHGYLFAIPFTGVTIKNSVAFRNALYGIIGASAGATATNNATYGNGSGATSNVTNTNPVTADPQLSASYRPMAGSPLLGAGTHLGYVRDLDKKQRPNPPSIGAFDVATMISG